MADIISRGRMNTVEEVPQEDVDESAFEDVNLDIEDLPEEDQLAALEEELEALEEQEKKLTDIGHDANLAEHIEEDTLHAIADHISSLIDDDYDSMSGWRERLARGYEMLGIKDAQQNDLPFDGASAVTHPMLNEAAIRFNAGAMAELMPPGGPVKTLVFGDETDESREIARRVERHMNYQMTVEDKGYIDDTDQLLYYIAFAGQAFRKTYNDPLKRVTCTSRFIRGENCIAPAYATAFHDLPRFTIEWPMHHNDVMKMMDAGVYRKIELSDPENSINNDDLKQQVFEIEGREDSAPEGDPGTRTMREVYIDYHLDDFPRVNANGEETELTCPYVITIDKDENKILSIYRNWEEGDEKYERIEHVTPYKFLPGLGLFGYGFIHLIGGLANATSGALRALLDAAAFSTLQGGFKTKDATIKGSEIELQPGVYIDVDMTYEELTKAFYTPNFKEPSQVLFSLMQAMENYGQRLVGTTEAAAGDAKNTGPVGTTVALIEQATKVMSGVHSRLHRALEHEMQIRARVNREFLPKDGMYFTVADGTNFVSPDDYDGGVKIIPVSDPNIVSSTQRIAVAQASLELAERAPQLYRLHRLHRRMQHALGVNDVDDIIVDPTHGRRLPPQIEGPRLLAGRTIKAYMDQNHEAHIAVHSAQIEAMKALPNTEQVMMLLAQMEEHIAYHRAYQLYLEQFAAIGMEPPFIDLYDDYSDNQPELTPQIEDQLATEGAQRIQEMIEYYQSRQPPPPKDMETEAKIRRENAEFAAEEARKQAEHEQKLLHAEEAFKRRMMRDDAKASLQSLREAQIGEAKKMGEEKKNAEKKSGNERK